MVFATHKDRIDVTAQVCEVSKETLSVMWIPHKDKSSMYCTPKQSLKLNRHLKRKEIKFIMFTKCSNNLRKGEQKEPRTSKQVI
jgi:hypothetical protein